MLMPTISIEEAIKRNYDSPNIQTILFDKAKWNKRTATAWLKSHNYKYDNHRTTKNQHRFLQYHPIEGATYYSKRLPNGIVLVFQNWDIEGAGFFDNVRSSLWKVADRLSFKTREAGKLPPRSRELLARIQNERITALTVVRTPIESYLNKALQFISGGTWQDAVRSQNYDKLFHLSLFINGRYVFHKIEVTTLAEENPIKPDSETMAVKGTFPTIGQLVENTRRAMGDQNFTYYNPATNNCQDFILAVLSANRLLTPELQKFIKQDAVAIFSKTPRWTAKIASAITNLGARFNRLIEGEAARVQEQTPIYADGLSTNYDLMRFAQKYDVPILAILMRDQIAKYDWDGKEGGIIINMADMNDAEGTHWTALFLGSSAKRTGKNTRPFAFYFDSFGMPPPSEVYKFLNKQNIQKLYWNNKQIQHLRYGFCGEYSISFIGHMAHKDKSTDLRTRFTSFINQFNNNYDNNI